MSDPKVFISFLGTSPYLACNYIDEKGGGRCDNVRFIQTAVRRLHCPDADKAIIFVTEKAETDNLPALQQECVDNSLPEMAPKRIPNGEHEDELWEIFRIVGDAVPKDSELFFDITHSFRSLPVLMTTLLNYLREVKGVRPAGCYYGAFEKLGRRDQVEQMPLEKRDAPIFDLTRFLDLNDWTDAIGQFTDYGRTEGLLKLTRGDLGGILGGNDSRTPHARVLRDVVSAVNDFTSLVHTANCGKLYEMAVRRRIVEPLENMEASSDSGLLPQLRPVLDKVRTMFADYEDGSLKNGLRAAAWCAEHDLIPQGFTMLQETIISLEVERRRERLDALMPDTLEQRTFISGLLAVTANPKKTTTENRQYTDKELALINELQADWSQDGAFLGVYDRLTDFRNQVNHGGTGNHDFRSANMREKLKELTEQVLAHYGVAGSAAA